MVAKRNFIPIDPDGPLGELTETCISVMLSFLQLHSSVTVFESNVFLTIPLLLLAVKMSKPVQEL